MGTNEPRLTGPTLRVLSALLSSPRDELSGAEIGREARLASGTLYPILARLEHAGWLSSRWEVEEPSALGRPRRRFYCITKSAFRELQPAFRRLAWL
jgi:PadR family transcriptional regulator PadR